MSNTSKQPVSAPPKMLGDRITNCQHLSANFPPDEWTDETSPPRIEHKRNGTLSLGAADTETRRVVSAPVPCTSPTRSTSAVPARPRYYQANLLSTSGLGASESDSFLVRVPNMSSSTSLINNPPATREVCLVQDGPYPVIGPARVPVTPTNRSDPAFRAPAPRTGGLRVQRTRSSRRSNSSASSLLPAGGTFTHTNGVLMPSPLRNVSLPGEQEEEIELIPRGLPRQIYELSGPREEPRNAPWSRATFWLRKWFCCCKRRK
ncbi:hypothetical protein BU23DRAFT_154320 [Bimuria novae-zelandiae CBS 107.79]|uniref:Uncharacterized protein n=1 Tax=Bimuria novae-zelandiae CBS 107.79 TaxID=1447943 RepID=A0A6A5VX01_9PLEO|nr:hypothetical protein BU23DRAFT_154320 [Bimuria novae-zelandiae CBS 107.79]